MDKKIMSVYLILGPFIIFFFNSCISFSFDSLKDKTAQDVTYQPPPELYKKVKKEGMDMAWENSENNNTLSFFSNCSRVTRFVPLKQFKNELLSGLKAFQVRNQTETLHQDQKAFYLLLDESNSNTQVMVMEMFLFKKANCFYVLSFLKSPSAEQNTTDPAPVFDNFIKGFQAP